MEREHVRLRPGRRRRPRLLLWLAFGLLVAAVGVIIAAFASSAWAPHVLHEVPAIYWLLGRDGVIGA